MSSSKKLSNLKQKTISSTLQLIYREIIMKITAILGQLLLVRLLEPSAFGIFAILSFLIATAEIFTDIGLNFTIIQKKQRPTHYELSTIFFIKLFLSTFVVIILNAFTPLLYFLYPQFTHTEELMFRLLTLTLLIKPLQSIITPLLERDLRYKEIAVIDLLGMVSYYIGALVFAVLGMGVWSFIWAVFIKTIIEVIVTFLYKPWLPKVFFQINQVKKYLNVGKYFQLALMIGVIHSAIIPILGGMKLSFTAVGFLDWSFNMASFPRIFIDNLARVVFTSFSRIQSNRQIIAESIEKSFAFLSVIAIHILVITLVFGNTAVHFFLTDKWLPALPALYWYVGSIFFMNGNGLMGQALLATGKVKNLFISSGLLTLIEFILAYLFLFQYGFTGIAISFFIATVLTFFTYIFLCHKHNINVDFRKVVIVNTIIFILSFGFSYYINIKIEQSLLFFFVKLVLASIVYFLLLVLISPRLVGLILKLVQNKKIE